MNRSAFNEAACVATGVAFVRRNFGLSHPPRHVLIKVRRRTENDSDVGIDHQPSSFNRECAQFVHSNRTKMCKSLVKMAFPDSDTYSFAHEDQLCSELES
jgi:hypothetical protein